MIELSMGSFIAAVIAGILGFGGALGSGNNAAKFLFFFLLILSLASILAGSLHRLLSRRSPVPAVLQAHRRRDDPEQLTVRQGKLLA